LKPLVVIPTYNERENITRLIPAILETDGRIHVLVIDDGSPDNTAEAVLDTIQNYPGARVFLESRPAKLGLGSAYVHGFQWGLSRQYDFLIQMDADWSHRPHHLETMLSLVEQTDFVVGSRYVPGGGVLNWGAGRRLLSKLGSWYSRLILGMNLSDFTGGFNGWPARVLRAIGLETLRSDGYSFQIELKYRAHLLGYRHIEFPILFDERRAGRSKMSAAIAFEAGWRVWQFRLKRGVALRRVAAG
jgi:dolichol-phosphate mannosyltransferase